MADTRNPLRWGVALALLLGVGAAGVWFGRETAPPTVPPPPAPIAEPPVPAPTPQYPPPAPPAAEPSAGAESPVEPLPPLHESDAPLVAALAALFGAEALVDVLLPEAVIQRVVATVDALPGPKLAPRNLPVKTARGVLRVQGGDDGALLDPANAERYAPYAALLERADTAALAALYLRHYPLFQQAWRELGHPDGHFNDRLVAVIDHLLAAPPAPEPLRLIRPKVFWEYADPAYEAASAGHKLLWRIGPANAALAQERLRAFRAAIVAPPPPG